MANTFVRTRLARLLDEHDTWKLAPLTPSARERLLASKSDEDEARLPEDAPGTTDGDADSTAEPGLSPDVDDGPSAGAGLGLEGRLLMGLLLRRFGYEDEVRGALREYSLRRAAWLGVEVRVYPGAALTAGILANVGLTASYERMFDVTSSVDGTPLPTSSSAWGFGARVRHRFTDFELGGGLGYGRHRFVVADTYVPDPDYQFARVNADATWRPARLLLAIQLGYRQIFGTGELSDAAWFPHLGAAGVFRRGFGIDGELLAGYSVLPVLDLLLGARVLRYRIPLAPTAGDENVNGVAGSAHDLFGAAFLGVGGRL